MVEFRLENNNDDSTLTIKYPESSITVTFDFDVIQTKNSICHVESFFNAIISGPEYFKNQESSSNSTKQILYRSDGFMELDDNCSITISSGSNCLVLENTLPIQKIFREILHNYFVDYLEEHPYPKPIKSLFFNLSSDESDK